MPAGPLSRYRDLDILALDHESRGATRSLAVRRKPVEADPVAFRHRNSAFEPVDLVAQRYLGSEELWWRVLDANDRRLPGSFAIGEVLDIPSRATATQMRRTG